MISLFETPQELPLEFHGSLVVIGNFDGVHKGHQQILNYARRQADQQGCFLGVLTFDPHPRQFFNADEEYFALMSPEQKKQALSELGVDFIYSQRFDAEFSRLSAEEFVDNILLDTLQARVCMVGSDFRFGHKRQGDIQALETLCGERDIGVVSIPDIKDESGLRYSSSRIRHLIGKAEFQRAYSLLGRPWSMEGYVEQGDQRGRELGYPTANMNVGHYIRPPFGIYAVFARLENQDVLYPAVASFGIRPMFQVQTPLLETHIFDFDKEIYGQKISVTFVQYLREEKKFENLDTLIKQMEQDCLQARQVLKDSSLTLHAQDHKYA